MLKNLGYDGTYHDENISVSILLENPLDFGLELTKLVFSITLRTKNNPTAPRMEDFAFYVMDEAHYLYNTQHTPYLKSFVETIPDDEPIRQPDGLIQTNFKHDFLFQDLRVAFYYRPYKKINIIELKR